MTTPITDDALLELAYIAGLDIHDDPDASLLDDDEDRLHYWQDGQIADTALLAFARLIETHHGITEAA